MRVKEDSETAGLKLNIRKTKITASGPITSWQREGEKVETVADFTFLGSKVTVDGRCSHKIKRCLLLGRKAMTNLDSIPKSRDIILPTKVHLVKAMIFPVVMYGCESWTIEHWRIDAFKLWFWRRLFGHLIWRADSSEKILMLGKTEGKKRRGQQRTRWLDRITNSIDMNLSKHREMLDREARCVLQTMGVTESDTT